MTITKKENGKALEIALEGRLDTMTAPELENELHTSLENADSLVLDFAKLNYISSAGLRVLLSAHKIMSSWLRTNAGGVPNTCKSNEAFGVDPFGVTHLMT